MDIFSNKENFSQMNEDYKAYQIPRKKIFQSQNNNTYANQNNKFNNNNNNNFRNNYNNNNNNNGNFPQKNFRKFSQQPGNNNYQSQNSNNNNNYSQQGGATTAGRPFRQRSMNNFNNGQQNFRQNRGQQYQQDELFNNNNEDQRNFNKQNMKNFEVSAEMQSQIYEDYVEDDFKDDEELEQQQQQQQNQMDQEGGGADNNQPQSQKQVSAIVINDSQQAGPAATASQPMSNAQKVRSLFSQKSSQLINSQSQQFQFKNNSQRYQNNRNFNNNYNNNNNYKRPYNNFNNNNNNNPQSQNNTNNNEQQQLDGNQQQQQGFNNNNNQYRRFIRPQIEELTAEEGQRLLELWKQRHFIDLNSWIQVSKAQFTSTLNDNVNQIDEKVIKNYICHVTLTLDANQPNEIVLKQMGVGKKKKNAKENAIEKIVIDLIENKLIQRGLKSKDPLQDQNFQRQIKRIQKETNFKKKQVAGMMNSNDEKAVKIMNKVHRMSKKMQKLLKEENFQEAIDLFTAIMACKVPDWNEIAFIWSYALLKKNMTFLQQILDVIQYKKVRKTENQSPLKSSPYKYMNEPQQDMDQKIVDKLVKKYGKIRCISTNPYDIYDLYNVEMNDLEIQIENTMIPNQEELNKEVVRDPFAKDIKVSLQPYLTFDPQRMSPKKMETERLNVPIFAYNNDEFKENDDEDNILKRDYQATQRPLKCFNNMQMQLNQGNFISNNAGGQYEIREPHTNTISVNLLTELYETLLYIGDMKFALSVAEMLFHKCKLNYDEFLTTQATHYFAHKKNMILIEQIELIFHVFNEVKLSNQIEFLTNIKGTVAVTGTKYQQQVLVLTPNELPETLDNKLLKKGQLEKNEMYHQIAEGEFVMLTSFFQPTFEVPMLEKSNSQLVNYINSLTRNEKEKQPFIRSITEFGNDVEFALIANVKEIKDYKIKLFVLPTQEESTALMSADRIWKITKLVNRNFLDRSQEALKTFCTYQTMSDTLLQIMLATPNANPAFLKQLADTKVLEQEAPNVNTQLNQSQKDALQLASYNTVTLIQGPPGTGKTVTTVEIVAEWLRHSETKILTCCYNDQLSGQLFKELQRAGINSIQVGAGFGEDELASYELNKFQQNSSKQKYFALKKRLMNAQVICTTFTCLNSNYLKNMKFSRVIVDDAHKYNEVVVIMSLIKHCEQLVLIGDHQQLGPQIFSTYAQSKGMGISFFERLIRQGVKPHLLATQYRIHPSLMIFSSHYFYKNAIENGVEQEQRSLISGFTWPNELIRTAIIQVKGFEQMVGQSLQNTKEVQVIIEVLMQLLQNNGIKIGNVAILTPYEAQKIKIKQEINAKAKNYAQLFNLTAEEASRINRKSQIGEVETIDNFKGTLKDLIILSAVRCNKQGKVGLLKDSRRLNTILTKAKRGFILIGDLETLCHDQTFRDYIKWGKKNDLLMQYF